MLENFALNLAAGCTQWFIQFSVTKLNRKLNDPLVGALRKVYSPAFQALAQSVVSDLEEAVGKLTEDDEKRVSDIFEEYLRLSEVSQTLLEMSRTQKPPVHDVLEKHFGLVNGPQKLLDIVRSVGGGENPVKLMRALRLFSATLQDADRC